MGVWRPVPGVLAEFTSHLESPELGELRLRLPLWNPPPTTTLLLVQECRAGAPVPPTLDK